MSSVQARRAAPIIPFVAPLYRRRRYSIDRHLGREF